MKYTVIIILSLGLLLSGAQSAGAQAVAGYPSETVGTEYGTDIIRPFSSGLPSDNLMNDQVGPLNSRWGGGGTDIPDPETTPAIGMTTMPTGEGFVVLCLLACCYGLAFRRQRARELRVKELKIKR